MRKIPTITWWFLLLSWAAQSQCPVADFSISGTSCLTEALPVTNSSTGATAYEWDFCSGDLALTPTAATIFTHPNLQRSRSFRVVKQNSEWIGFSIDQVFNKLLRFDFGSSLANTPTMTNLENPGSLLQGAFDFHLVQKDGSWFAFVANSDGNNLLRFDFGADLKSTPTATNLGSFGLFNAPDGIFAVDDQDDLTVFVSNGGNASMIRLSYGNAVTNTPSTASIAIAGSAIPRGISIIRECGRWFGLLTSYNNNKIFYLDFVSGLNAAPTVGDTGLTPPSFPASITIQHEGGSFYAFVQSALGDVYRVNFGTSIIDLTGTGQNLGNLGISNDNSAMTWANEGTTWYGFSIDNTVSARLMRLTLPAPCMASPSLSASASPIVTYSQSGTKQITLRAFNAMGDFTAQSHAVSVSGVSAPSLDFQSQNVCALSPVDFTAQSPSAPVLFNWDFGNGNTSAQPSPSETFATAGTYSVSLSASFSNGCSNYAAHLVTVYNPPSADFDLPPASPVCTNQSYLLDNKSVYDAPSNPSWEWRLNGNIFSTSEEPGVAFTTATAQEIRLKAILTGCSSEMIKNLATVEEGPLVEFITSDDCVGNAAPFTNMTTGTVTGYSWDFDDGSVSTQVNPSHVFAAPGTYQVSLMATNAAGCQNSRQHPLTIYSVPSPDFVVGLPPFSCANSQTPFQNTTPSLPDSNISGWSWTFGDGSTSTEQNPAHTYTAPGSPGVTLSATTNKGCVGVISRPVTISSSPNSDFTFGPACVNEATQFTDVSTGDVQSRLWQIGSSTFTTPGPAYTFSSSGSFPATLTVTASNGCSNVRIKPVTVPIPAVVNFSVQNTCAEQDALFTDMTNSPTDPASAWNWLFAGNAATGNPAAYRFALPGTYSVKLTTSHASGCKYSLTKSVVIHASPTASFIATPDRGAAPLTVQFTNESVNATAYSWKFNDKVLATSTRPSPVYTFTSLGEYSAELTASNDFGCMHVASKTITVLVPSIDLVMSNLGLLLDASTGKLRPLVTVLNNSNVPVYSVEVEVSLGGKAMVNEILDMVIAPGQSASGALSLTLSPTQYEFLCAEAVSPSDVKPDNNKDCLSLGSAEHAFEPYPNPSTGPLQVDWISPTTGTMLLTIWDASGKKAYEWDTPSAAGLNQSVHNLDFLSPGIYFLTLQTPAGRTTRRFTKN